MAEKKPAKEVNKAPSKPSEKDTLYSRNTAFYRSHREPHRNTTSWSVYYMHPHADPAAVDSKQTLQRQGKIAIVYKVCLHRVRVIAPKPPWNRHMLHSARLG